MVLALSAGEPADHAEDAEGGTALSNSGSKLPHSKRSAFFEAVRSPSSVGLAAATVAAGFLPAVEPGFQPGGWQRADPADDAERKAARSESAPYQA